MLTAYFNREDLEMDDIKLQIARDPILAASKAAFDEFGRQAVDLLGDKRHQMSMYPLSGQMQISGTFQFDLTKVITVVQKALKDAAIRPNFDSWINAVA